MTTGGKSPDGRERPQGDRPNETMIYYSVQPVYVCEDCLHDWRGLYQWFCPACHRTMITCEDPDAEIDDDWD